MTHPFHGMDASALLRERARQRGDHPFLIFVPFQGSSVRLSYAQFADAVARVAGGLARRGIGPGDRVLLCLENCPETLIARFACGWIGAVAVLGNPALTGPELAHAVSSSVARGAVTQPRLAATLARHCGALEWIAVTDTDAGDAPDPATHPAADESFAALFGEHAAPVAPDPERPALILFTTGTTGSPKGVLWTHANLLWGARLGALQQAIRADDICHLFLPLFHVVGFSWCLLPALWSGATVLLQPRFSASRYWPVAAEHGATVGSQVIFTSKVLAQAPIAPHAFRQWTVARHDPAHAAHFGVREVSGWGMTEVVAQAIVGDPFAAQRPGSIGRPSLAYRIAIEDDDGRPVQPGQTGHLLVHGIPGLSIFRRYDGDEGATRDAFDARGFFRTGDRVILHEDGWIEFADRTKDVIKVGGEGVSAAEIEAVIRRVPGVAEVAVIGKPDPVYGEVAAAFVIGANEDHAALEAQILAACSASLAKFKVPRQIVFVPDLPRVGFGKIAKAKLRAQLAACSLSPLAGREPAPT
jgi:crotonobetaine/carnitine-CoA ligase